MREKLISRIIFLEGMPIVTNYREIKIGSEIPKQLVNDHNLEDGAVKGIQCGNKTGGRSRRLCNKGNT